MRKCTIEGCNNIHEARGYCVTHYTRWRNNGDPHKVKRVQKAKGLSCNIPKCKNSYYAKGFCEPHYKLSDGYKEKRRIYRVRRKARKAAAPINDFTKQEWVKCLKHFNNRCAYCGDSDERLQVEHVNPLSRKGSHTKTNIIPSCSGCNYSKGVRTLEEWYHNQVFYSKTKEKAILEWLGYEARSNKIQMRLL